MLSAVRLKILPFCLLLLLSSCGIYKNDFDCRPGKGIGCAPVGEVLNLIVEREEEEDLFVKDPGTALILRQQQKEKRAHVRAEEKYYLIQDGAGQYQLVPLKP